MPNFKLGSRCPDDIKNRCAALTHRTVQHMQADFPLTAVEIELRKYILPETEFVAVKIRRDAP